MKQAEMLIGQFKSIIESIPAFATAAAERYFPTEKLSDEVKQKALAQFWEGSGEGIGFVHGGRFVEIAYLRGLNNASGHSVPDSPDVYETLEVLFLPNDTINMAQELVLSTKSEGCPISYNETQDVHIRTADSFDEYKEIALQGAHHVSDLLQGTAGPTSIFEFDIRAPLDRENKIDILRQKTITLK
jgi:hypothetical protein